MMHQPRYCERRLQVVIEVEKSNSGEENWKN